jgi:uroporphyrin-III C-methyltransferase/precorrin-2 dehydrogenase/sirohydrochlorin ferrochelatase
MIPPPSAEGTAGPAPSHELFPAFLKLAGKRVLLVGAGPVGASKLQALLGAGAAVVVVAPEVHPDIAAAPVTIHRRAFSPSDLDDVWYVVAAAPAEVNRAVSEAAAARRLFVNAVDDPPNASVYLGAVVRRGGLTLAISTSGRAPALAGLLREGLEALIPHDLAAWLEVNDRERARWKAEGVPMEHRRGRLLQAINDLYRDRQRERAQPHTGPFACSTCGLTILDRPASESRTASPAAEGASPMAQGFGPAAIGPREPAGFASLVGAGPGDPELLTLRAVQRLRDADLVLYDALVSPEILALASHAQCISVGKRHGRHSVTQETINRLLVRAARRRRRVVRLKAGDPFVFGRGGEEALALASAGLPCEVVPGVSSATSAAALAGIPVTHRGLASSFVVVSGHAESAWAPVLDGLSPRSATLVVLMGVNTRHALANRLVSRGWAMSTPVALLFSASTPDSRTWIGTLGDLAADVPIDVPGGPGTLVIGEVVSLAATLGTARPDAGRLHSDPPLNHADRRLQSAD